MLLQFFNIKNYVVDDRETTMRILKKINKKIISSCVKHMNGQDLPCEYFVGFHYIGYLTNISFEPKLYIITTESIFQELTYHDQDTVYVPRIDAPPETKIKVFIRKGTYKSTYYQSITLNLNHIKPFDSQRFVMDDILEIYNKLGRASVFIHGVSHAGKSSVGYLLAKELHADYCHSFNPSDPGDHLSNLITDTYNDKPLIIVLEESDIIITNIHNQTIHVNPEIYTSVRNKSTWATFLDDMIFYNNVILILTSNTSKSDIDALDESYLRKGRIHANFSMMEKIIVE